MAKFIYKGTEIEADSRCEALELLVGLDLKAKPLYVSQKPEITDIRWKLPWSRSNGTMNKSNINRLIVHHDAQWRLPIYNSFSRYRSQANIHIKTVYKNGRIVKGNWGHISYHYIIDNVGEIFQCLNETEIGYHAGVPSVNVSSIAIKLDGNFETQKPTDAQIRAYKELVNYLTTQRPDLPNLVKSSIRGHRDIKATLCPGKNFYPLIRNV